MKRALAFVAVVLTAVTTSHARQQPAPLRLGLVVVSVEPGSAPDLAGLKAGDQLISWTRSASATAAAATGEFRTPFDAREFELEQLPRGGTMVTVMRNGARIEARLIPGFWGASVRPAFSDAELVALVTWQPLIDRLVAAGDRGTAAWLMTRVASSLVARDQLTRADELFDRAAALFKEPASRTYEAMVWEAKGLSYRPELARSTSIDPTTVRPPKLVAALEAHERARVLRMTPSGDRTLASAESEGSIVATLTSAPNYFYAAEADGTRPGLERADQLLNDVTDFMARQAPGSFARSRALSRMSNVLLIGHGPAPYGDGRYNQSQAQQARLPMLRQALSALEIVAPTHATTRAVLDSLQSYLGNGSVAMATMNEDTRRELESVQRKRMHVAELVGDRKLLETAAMSLALSEVQRGAIADALAIRDELLRTGSTYPSLAVGLNSLALAINAAGARPLAIEVLEALVKETSAPYVYAVSNLAAFYRQAGDLTSEARVLALLERRIDNGTLTITERVDFADRLGQTALDRQDLDAAQAWAQRALVEAQSSPATSSPAQLAIRYNLLWDIARRQADQEAAKKYLNLSIAQYRQIRNPTVVQQSTLRNRLLSASTSIAEREAIWAQELADARKASPGTDRERTALWNLGLQQHARGDLIAAHKTLLDVLAITRRLQPGSAMLQDTLRALGQVSDQQGDNTAALEYFKEAFALQEDRRLNSVGVRELWTVPSDATTATPVDTNVTVLLAELFVKMGDPSSAFEIAERSRAGKLLQMLRTRSAQDTASVPAELDQERQRLENEYRNGQRDVSVAKDGAAVVAARAELSRRKQRLDDIVRQISDHYPVAAALEQPAVASLADARASLDPGTILLSYLTGSFKTFLFVVTSDADTPAGESGLVVYELPVAGFELQKSISAFGRLIEWDDLEPMLSGGRALYDTLIRPAERQIGRAQRILLSLDGPLQSLSFESLVRNQTGKPQFLQVWKPLHRTPSMSVYAETTKGRRAVDPAGSLVAFGDPEYVRPTPAAASMDADVEEVLRSGGSMTRLPGTRREVEAIARLFSPKATTFMDTSATSAQAKAIGKSVRFIHFAVHGVLNETLPMNSALVFAPAGDNGLLAAWEIFAHMRIDADLVTLSACESGLGKDLAGEGLVGLTRAFLFAGARTVAASLWKVSDGPTAELMTRFYANLRAGQSKDEALRNAQIALIKMGRPPGSRVDFSSPKYWAAFTLTGDWK